MACITLLSDFGLRDASVASAKGILLQYTAATPLIDISHLIEPFNIHEAAYLLFSSYRNFPVGSIHISLIAVFSEKNPVLVLAEKDGHYFLCPDNGLLTIAFGDSLSNIWNCYELRSLAVFKDWLQQIGIAVQSILQHNIPSNVMQTYRLRVNTQSSQPVVTADMIEGQVLYIDRYQNVILNITKTLFDEKRQDRNFRILFMRNDEVNEISTHYNDVKPNQKLCRFNAAGFLEIALSHSNAAGLLGFRATGSNALYYTVKIFFE